MSLSFDIADWRDENKVSVGRRALAARFRRGENLTRPELYQLRQYAEDNGNGYLAALVTDELRATRGEEEA